MRPVAEDSAAVAAGRRALGVAAAHGQPAWLVGGAVRDALQGGRVVKDLDLAVAGDVRPLANAIAEALGAPCFSLSDRYGGYRVTARGGLQVDVMPLAGDTIEQDIARRDVTVNALAIPAAAAASGWPIVAAADVIDLVGGLPDLSSRRLRAVSERAFTDDPLRVLRVARMAATGPWQLDGAAVPLARAAAPGLGEVAGERSGEEFRQLLSSQRPLEGLRVLALLGGTAALLPELSALEGIEQSPYHHRDVAGHTADVLRCAVDLEQRLDVYVDPGAAQRFTGTLDDPVGGEWSRRSVLRLAALLHDSAKPQTRTWYAERGIVGFPDHDRQGQRITGEIGRRLRLPRRVIERAGALTRHHLRLGYLVHARPLDRGEIYDYLRRCDPVSVDVTVLALADRLATRGRGAVRAIELHAALTRELLPLAQAWERQGGAPQPLVDGHQLVRRTGREPGAWIAAALEAQRRARYVDPQLSADDALQLALDAGAAG